jgi:hypothetical protein
MMPLLTFRPTRRDRLSMSVQRVVMLERQRADDLAARLAAAEAKLALYEGAEGADEEIQEVAAA